MAELGEMDRHSQTLFMRVCDSPLVLLTPAALEYCSCRLLAWTEGRFLLTEEESAQETHPTTKCARGACTSSTRTHLGKSACSGLALAILSTALYVPIFSLTPALMVCLRHGGLYEHTHHTPGHCYRQCSSGWRHSLHQEGCLMHGGR